MSEIKKIINITGYEITKFLYYHMENVHNLLKSEDEIILLSSEKIDTSKLSFYVYLSLLINNNLNIVNYNYSFDFIEKLNSVQIEKNKQIKEIIK